MVQHGIPVMPGSEGEVHSLDAARRVAKKVGYPVIFNPSAGGGGRGMRVITRKEDLDKAILAAQLESRTVFGSDGVYLEKFFVDPRHIEIQVLADEHGHVIHLGERDCSIQRRYQKLVEESPSPAVDDSLREEMGKVAVKAVKSVKYRNAGTVEFLLDQNRKFYFMEVNTRIQVEHPITEMVTGVDLVKEQIRIAKGEALKLTQEDITFTGHSIEARIYAEDPANDFLPSTGKLILFQIIS